MIDECDNMRYATCICTNTLTQCRNKQLPTFPSQVEFAGGKLKVSEGCPLDNLKFHKIILLHVFQKVLSDHYKVIFKLPA